MTGGDRDDGGAGTTPTEPADEEPQVIDEAVRGVQDPDSPGLAIATESSDLPEPNEPG